MVEARLCDEGSSCGKAFEAGRDVTRFAVAVVAVRSKRTTKGSALLEEGENCRANLDGFRSIGVDVSCRGHAENGGKPTVLRD